MQRIARRKLEILDAAERLEDLRIPPANRLEKLHGKREGRHSIRVNDQWRVMLRWLDNSACDVRLMDYH